MPQLKFLKLPELSETNRARKLIFGLQVNINKANNRRYGTTLLGIDGIYRGPSKDPQSAHQCTVYILRKSSSS